MIWLLAIVVLLAVAIAVGKVLARGDLTQEERDQRELRRYARYIKAMNKFKKS